MGYNEENTGIVGELRKISKGYFDLQFYYDISKRTSKCTICRLPVPPKSARVVFGSRNMIVSRKDGKRVPPRCIKYYAHYQCWVAPQEDHRCVDCGELIPAYHASAICFWCMLSPRYRQCGHCESLVRAPDVRHYRLDAVEGGPESIDSEGRVILCRGCRSRADFNTQIKYTKIMETIDKTGTLWSNG